jgi:PD-(D/E)XK endonuclease
MEHPKDVGDKSTIAIMLALHAEGYAVLLPFGENTRYDLVIDNGTCLRKIQCKTGRLRDGAVLFPTCSSYAHHPNSVAPRRDYKGQVDDFAVFCPQLGSVYLIPIQDLDVRALGTLRVRPPANGQHKNIRLAATYEIARIDVY